MSSRRPSGIQLFSNEHIALRADHPRRIIWAFRTSQEFQSVAEIDACGEALARVFPVERRVGFGILYDLRAAPFRMSPALDPAYARYRREVERGFAAAVVVAETALGQIRARRLAQDGTRPVAVVSTVDEALDYISRVQLRGETAGAG